MAPAARRSSGSGFDGPSSSNQQLVGRFSDDTSTSLMVRSGDRARGGDRRPPALAATMAVPTCLFRRCTATRLATLFAPTVRGAFFPGPPGTSTHRGCHSHNVKIPAGSTYVG
jgi:hypothetical protein